jgi:hypothetical protein
VGHLTRDHRQMSKLEPKQNMIKHSKFVIAKKNIKVTDLVSVEIGDVGIIESESPEGTSIFFVRIWQKITLKNDDFKIFDVKKTGDAFPKKICNICHRLLATTQFDRNQNGINNRPVRRPSCKTCRKILDGMNIKPKAKGAWLKNKPSNIPFECPVCGKRTIAGVTSKIVLDHNHITGTPRAWICDSCNTGIGRFKDDIALLQKAIKFLE